MALKFKAKIDSASIRAIENKLKKLGKPLEQKDYVKIGRLAVREMKKLISRGQSPVRGGGYSARFPRYKRQDDPRGYPANVKKRFPRKRQRPVNLKLSGQFLNSLKFEPTSRGVSIGYFNEEAQSKEEGHRKGKFTQPERPTIPDVDRNERFAPKIIDIYLKVANARIRAISKRKN